MPLTINEARDSFSFSGADVEPEHWAWALAGPRERTAYYRTLGRIARRYKIRELDAGIGVDGRKLKPVRPESRPDGAAGPPLSPHGAASRIQSRLVKEPFVRPDRCTLYWLAGWRKVIRGHRIGYGHLPIRDVVGLTKADARRAVAEARAEWARGHGMTPAAQAAARPKPIPRTPAAVPGAGGRT